MATKPKDIEPEPEPTDIPTSDHKANDTGNESLKQDDAVKGYTVDFKIFESAQDGDHCDGKHGLKCKGMERVMAALDYYQFLVLGSLAQRLDQDPKVLFDDFCRELYPKRVMLNDYIHWVMHHRDPESIMAIRSQLHFICESAKRCGATGRHYGDRRRNGGGADEGGSSWYSDKMDALHFNIYHLNDVGLRVPKNVMEDALPLDEEKEVDSEFVDVALKKMVQEIDSKRAEFQTERLDGSENSKFTLQVQQQKVSGNGVGNKGNANETTRDFVARSVWNQKQNEKPWRRFNHFVDEHDVDTDCIEEDVVVYTEENDSNLHRALDGDGAAMNAVSNVLRHYHIMGRSFATGLPLFYWEYYRTAKQREIDGEQLYSDMGLGSHSVQELSVYPRFNNIKEEVLETGLIGPKDFKEFVVDKAAGIMESERCRKIVCKNPCGGYYTYGADPLHAGIANGSGIEAKHIESIIIYCDFTKICTRFGETLREISSGESLESLKARNSKFYNLSRNLREVTAYFGSNGRRKMNGTVVGPFYSGVSVVLNLSEFSIGFNTPTSTSKTNEVALRFAGSDGMVITVGNEKGDSGYQPMFNATWISAFVEEDEYFYFGSYKKLSVDDIFVVENARVYGKSMAALYLLDTALSGGQVLSKQVTEKVLKILSFCLKTALNEAVGVRPRGVDQYVEDNVYCWRHKKEKIFLDLLYLQDSGAAFQKLIFYGLSKTKVIPKDKTNIFRVDLFSLFPNVVEMELWTDGYPPFAMNLLSLLSVLEEAVIPSSFKRLRIKDGMGGDEWIEKAFTPKVKEQFEAKKFMIKKEDIEGIGYWIVVEPLF